MIGRITLALCIFCIISIDANARQCEAFQNWPNEHTTKREGDLLIVQEGRKRCHAVNFSSCLCGVTDQSMDYYSPPGYRVCSFTEKASTNPQWLFNNGGMSVRPDKKGYHFYFSFDANDIVLDYYFEVVNIKDSYSPEQFKAHCKAAQ